MPCSPEDIFWIIERELDTINCALTKEPYAMQNWFGTITLYSRIHDDLVVVMDCGGDCQMLYGAVTEVAYRALLGIVGDMGEGQ